MAKKKKIEKARIVSFTFYCPNLKRNIRLNNDGISFEGEYEYGSVILQVNFMCRCGKYHEVRMASLGGSVNYYLENYD